MNLSDEAIRSAILVMISTYAPVLRISESNTSLDALYLVWHKAIKYTSNKLPVEEPQTQMRSGCYLLSDNK